MLLTILRFLFGGLPIADASMLAVHHSSLPHFYLQNLRRHLDRAHLPRSLTLSGTEQFSSRVYVP